jgi:hypothetical protein
VYEHCNNTHTHTHLLSETKTDDSTPKMVPKSEKCT